MKRNVLFLVHGVGEALPGQMQADVDRCGFRKKYAGTKIKEICWNEVVPQVWHGSWKKPVNMAAFVEVAKSLRLAIDLIRANAMLILKDWRAVWLKHLFGICDALFWAGLFLATLPFLAKVLLLGFKWFPGFDDGMYFLLSLIPDFSLHQAWVYAGYAISLLALGVVLEAVMTGGILYGGTGSPVLAAVAGAGSIVLVRVAGLVLVLILPLIAAANIILGARWKAILTISVILLGARFIMHTKFTSLGISKSLCLACLGIAALLLVHRFFAFLGKIFGDIFHYVSDSEMRSSILDYFDAKFQPAIVCYTGNIYIAAHSLGTVIALDYLLNRAQPLNRKITLLTGGSPLRRFFFRFFKGILFPATAHGCVERLREKFQKFDWMNIYRSFDYVGQRLGLPEIPGCLEVRQFRLLRAHLNYWADETIHLAVRDFLSNQGSSHSQPIRFVSSSMKTPKRDATDWFGCGSLIFTAILLACTLPFFLSSTIKNRSLALKKVIISATEFETVNVRVWSEVHSVDTVGGIGVSPIEWYGTATFVKGKISWPLVDAPFIKQGRVLGSFRALRSELKSKAGREEGELDGLTAVSVDESGKTFALRDFSPDPAFYDIFTAGFIGCYEFSFWCVVFLIIMIVIGRGLANILFGKASRMCKLTDDVIEKENGA